MLWILIPSLRFLSVKLLVRILNICNLEIMKNSTICAVLRSKCDDCQLGIVFGEVEGDRLIKHVDRLHIPSLGERTAWKQSSSPATRCTMYERVVVQSGPPRGLQSEGIAVCVSARLRCNALHESWSMICTALSTTPAEALRAVMACTLVNPMSVRLRI